MTAGAITVPRPAVWPWFDWNAVKKWLKWLLMFSFMVSGIQLIDQAAPTYYVDDISDDCTPATTGSGTISDPWTNLHWALRFGGLVAGDHLQLRAGTYRIKADTPFPASHDCYRLGAGANSGEFTVADLSYISGTASQPIIIENYPGEAVIIDGTDTDMDTTTWTNCAGSRWDTTAFNVSSARTGQIWVNPSGPGDPGTRLIWNAVTGSCPVLAAGEFAIDAASASITIRMPDDSSANDADIHLTCQAGDCALFPIYASGTSGAEYITVRKNPSGGTFHAKYGYYIGYMSGDVQNITFDGVDFVAGGGRDYGSCFRTNDADFTTIKNGICRETMGEGVMLYGGGPGTGDGGATGIQTTNSLVENMEIYDTGRAWVDGGGLGTSLGMSIVIKSCSDCTARDNVVRNSYRQAIHVVNATECGASACSSDNVLIERNSVSNFCRFRTGSEPNNGQSDCGGISVTIGPGTANNPTIRNNMVFGNISPAFVNNAAPAGIYTDGFTADITGAVIANNSLNDIPGACIDTHSNTTSVRIVGNTMDNCATAGSGACSANVCNLWVSSVAADPDYNNFWSALSSDIVIRDNVTNYTRANVTSYSANAKAVDPDHVSATDLHINGTSGLQDLEDCAESGVPSDDFDGNSRPSSGTVCDIGAHQFD